MGNQVKLNANWNKQDDLFELPSGSTVRLRTHLTGWAMRRAGLLTDDMQSAFEQIEAQKIENAESVMDLEAGIVKAMFVEPQIVTDPDEVVEGRSYLIDALTDEDLQFVMVLAFGGVAEAERFRADLGRAGSGTDGEDVADAPKRANGNAKRKSRSTRTKQGASGASS